MTTTSEMAIELNELFVYRVQTKVKILRLRTKIVYCSGVGCVQSVQLVLISFVLTNGSKIHKNDKI